MTGQYARMAVACICAGLGALLVTACGSPAEEQSEQPTIAWAYPMAPAANGSQRSAEDGEPQQLNETQVTYSMAEIRSPWLAVDWFPAEHPDMPQVVSIGREPVVRACGHCHLPTGNGRPENAPLAGLPRDYIIEQLRAFQTGERKSSVAGRNPIDFMVSTAQAMTTEEIEAAADYFSGLNYRSMTSVREAEQVPVTLTTDWIYSRDPAAGSEPLGMRIIEMPEEIERFELRDPRTAYVAYVPEGSIARGEALARNWGESGQFACTACHGEDLLGLGNVPPLAGRSPTYLVRQLNDFRTGARTGPVAALMTPVVEPMQYEDMVALAAFLGALQP